MDRSQVQLVIRALASDFEGKEISGSKLADVILSRLYTLIPIAEEFLLDKTVEEVQKIINEK